MSTCARNRRASFNSLRQWVDDARALGSPNLVLLLVGNKLDEEDNREVEYLEAAEWAKENGQYCSTLFISDARPWKTPSSNAVHCPGQTCSLWRCLL